MSDNYDPSDPMKRNVVSKDRSAQPDIINLRQLPTSTAQEVESDVLRPVVFSSDNTFCRFELEPKGFLSPSSSISLGCQVKTTDNILTAFYPLSVGVHSLIQRAVLKTSSGRVICDVDEFGWFKSLKNAFEDNCTQLEKDQYKSGTCLAWGPSYLDVDDTANTDGFEANTEAEYLQLQNGKEYGGEATDGSRVGLTPRKFSIVTSEANHNELFPTFSIALHDLFPFLKGGNQLPLFMMGNDRIQIELYFTPPESFERMVLSKADEGDTGFEFQIDQNSVEFISDHIFYPGQMETWASMNKDLTFQYFDYVISRQQITSAADGTDNSKTNVRNVGGAGRLVTRCYAGYKDQAASPDLGICSHYGARGCVNTGDAVGFLESNLFYNEKFLYPQDVMNGARHYHNLRDAEKRQLYVPRPIYSGGGHELIPDAGAGATHHYDGRTQDQLVVNQFYQGWRLNHGERVGSKGIELHMNMRDNAGTGQGLATGKYLQIAYTEQLRYATLKDGQIEVYWS